MEETVKNYIFGYPWHLEDGTISRPYSWPSEGLIELTGQVSAFFILQYSKSAYKFTFVFIKVKVSTLGVVADPL